MEKGSDERRAILAGLEKHAAGWNRGYYVHDSTDDTMDIVFQSSAKSRAPMTAEAIMSEWEALESRVKSLLREKDWGVGGANVYDGVSKKMGVQDYKGNLRIAVLLTWKGDMTNEGGPYSGKRLWG
jgi:hypothetical protein